MGGERENGEGIWGGARIIYSILIAATQNISSNEMIHGALCRKVAVVQYRRITFFFSIRQT